ncbi:hypothetical protein [Rufibacter soli]
MEATSNVNKEKDRVEIRFPFSPSGGIKKQLSAKGFTYDPTTQTWQKDHVVGANLQAGRIVYNFNSELN